VPCRGLSGLFDESGLDEVPVERECRGEPALCNDDEGDAVRQRVTLVLALPEVVETLWEQVFVNVYRANRRAGQKDFTNLDSLVMVTSSVEESDYFVEDVAGGRQNVGRRKPPPMITCRFVILVVRVLQGDEEAGVEEDLRVNHRIGSFAVQVAVVILGAIACPGLYWVLPKSQYWIVGGQHEEPARFLADLDLPAGYAFEHLPGDEASFFGDLRFHLYSLVSPGDASVRRS
jgi:hypothetical protein